MAKFKLTAKTLERIQASYQWSIGETVRISPNLRNHTCPHWRMPLVAPIQLMKKRLTVADVRSVERYFKRSPPKDAFDAKSPYVQWLRDPYFDTRANLRLLETEGWSASDLSGGYLNVYTSVRSVMAPVGYEVITAHYKDVRQDVLKLSQEVFGLSDQFMREVDILNHRANENVVCSVIYATGRKRKLVASGLAQTCGRGTYLYSGCVLESHRGRGLWRLLLGARQAMSNTGPGHIWLLSSSNDLIKRSGDYSAQMMIYEKKA